MTAELKGRLNIIFNGFINASRPVLGSEEKPLPTFYGKSSTLSARMSREANGYLYVLSMLREANGDVFKLEDLLKDPESAINFCLHTKFDKSRL